MSGFIYIIVCLTRVSCYIELSGNLIILFTNLNLYDLNNEPGLLNGNDEVLLQKTMDVIMIWFTFREYMNHRLQCVPIFWDKVQFIFWYGITNDTLWFVINTTTFAFSSFWDTCTCFYPKIVYITWIETSACGLGVWLFCCLLLSLYWFW